MRRVGRRQIGQQTQDLHSKDLDNSKQNNGYTMRHHVL